MKNFKKRVVSLALAVIMMLSITSTAHAWKLNTHVYSGNLILEDLKDGYLTINGNSYKVPSDIYNAVTKYPRSYRAGTLGPDIYPEIATGQGVIHANDSGKHLELLMEAYTRLPLTHPNREKIYAFILGYATHYAGDLFGHDFINEWAEGVFPSMEEMAEDSKKAEIALKHIAVEGYIDSKIFKNKPSGTSNTGLYDLNIDAPIEFIKDILLIENAKVLEVQEFVKAPIDLIDDLRQYSENNKAFGGNIFEYAYKTNAAGYADRWAEDIDTALYQIVNTHQNMAKDMLNPNKGTSDTVGHLEEWVKNYGLSAAGAPDLVAKALGVSVDTLMKMLVGISPEEVREKIKQAKSDLIYSAIETATGVSIEEMIDAMKHPERLLNDVGLFDTGSKTSQLIDEQIGNFALENNVDNMDFAPFKNTVTMGKLILLGSDNLNNIFPNGPRFSQQECTESFDKIEVYVHTQYDKDSWLGTGNAGTNNDNFFFIKYKDHAGKTVEYKYLMDKPGYDDFERGDKDTYAIQLPERIGYEQIVSVGVESKKAATFDEWQPQYISIYVKDSKVIAASGPGSPSGDQSFKMSFDYSGEKWTAPNHILFNQKVRSGYASFDPKVVSFIKSLDAGTQWLHSNYYNENVYKWNQIFDMPTLDAIDITPYFDKLDAINNVDTTGFNKDITFINVSNWAKTELRRAVNNGLYNKQGLYNNCKRNITREEFATIAVNAYKSITGTRPEPASIDTFVDTEDANILIAYELGIISGKGKDTNTGKNIFAPKLPITRQEMAIIMQNTVKALGIDYDTGVNETLQFKDVNNIANWAKNAAKYASKNGFIQGDGVNFQPLNNTPVEQAVIIANRFFEKYENDYPKSNEENKYSIDIQEEAFFNPTYMITYGEDDKTGTSLNGLNTFKLDVYNVQNAEYQNNGFPIATGVGPAAVVGYGQNDNYQELKNIPVTSVYNARFTFGDIEHESGNGGFIFGVEEMKPGNDQLIGYFAGIYPKQQKIEIGEMNYGWNPIDNISIPNTIDLTKEIEFTMAVHSESGNSLVSFYINRQHIGDQMISESFSHKKSMAGLRVWSVDMNIYDFDILGIYE